MIQTTKDQVSLGSHPHGRPHACSAQIAPAMTVKVQVTKPTPTIRYAHTSSLAATGIELIRRKNGDGDSFGPVSSSLTSRSMAFVASPERVASSALPADFVRALVRKLVTPTGSVPTVLRSAVCCISCRTAYAAPR